MKTQLCLNWALIKGSRKYFDSKAWAPDKIKNNIVLSLKTTAEKNGEKAGQLYCDIVDMVVRKKYDVVYGFDFRITDEQLGKVPEWIIDGLREKSVRMRLIKHINRPDLASGTKEAERFWEDFLMDLKGNLSEFAMRIPKYGTY